MCPILDGHGVMGIFYSRTRLHVNRSLCSQLPDDLFSLVAYRLRKLQRATHAVHNRAAACVAAVVAFSKTSYNHRSIQIKGNVMKLTLHLYFKCILYYAGLLFCAVYCQ